MNIHSQLVPEDELVRLAASAEEILDASNIVDEFLAFRSLRFALSLEHVSNRLPDEHRAPLKIFYSRVYWFNRFVEEVRTTARWDPAIESQALSILETPPDDVDWLVVEQLLMAAKES